MPDESTIDGLLEGAFDTHIHSAPDVLPRKFNDLELAQRFKARRMAGFVLKSHYICTADRATLVRRVTLGLTKVTCPSIIPTSMPAAVIACKPVGSHCLTVGAS